ncbi:hypothetical protein BUALT_Bualt03G0110600 [Buddleja alternifolia]|uniref:Wax synthase domain-containing protein n=1 Tax=Buddleja alternifolia TaxID=168488 RepID=A0AAV6XT79_9LAMI|nr:hypothetical protein BUALT_Bualt03G0110600 [Buddleja alternifolia]
MEIMEGDEMKNVSRVWMVTIACLCYCYYIAAKLPKGKWRLISIAPIFYIFAILPLYLTSAFFTAVTGFFITWFASFKLLLFAFDQGPLSSKNPKPLSTFIAIAALACRVKPKNNAPPAPKKPTILPLYLSAEIPFCAVVISLLFKYEKCIHPIIVFVACYCLVFLYVEVLVGLSSLLVRVLLGLEIEPPSDEPYLSTSLQDFWGRRWNLMVTSILRETIYEPVRSATMAALGRYLAALVGVLAAFTVSGLMHELVLWYITRASPSWEMTMFFVVQGFCVVVEYELKKKWRVPVPWYVSGPLTLGFLLGTSYWLFFGPVMRGGGVVARLAEEFRHVGKLVEKKLRSSIPQWYLMSH